MEIDMDATNPLGALASVLARDLNDIEDLPNYVAPPPGTYKLVIQEVGQKEIKDKATIAVTYLIGECVALADPSAEDHKGRLAAIKPGDLMSEAFYFDKADKIETTLSVLKAKFGGLGEALGTTNLLEIMQKMKGMQVQCQITNRVDDNDKNKWYPSTKNMVPAV
jgi:hypothetical protein